MLTPAERIVLGEITRSCGARSPVIVDVAGLVNDTVIVAALVNGNDTVAVIDTVVDHDR